MKTLTLITMFIITTHALATGWRGTDGWSGSNRTVTAGQPMSINLSGSDGSNGGDGSDGSRGSCGSHTDSNGQTVSDDRQGDNGEDGGDGGNGGDGGDLIVLFTDYVELKTIRFVSYYGDGGKGGRGGRGGSGCPNGNDGRDGMNGHSGSYGILYLVQKQFQPLQKDNSRSYMKVNDLLAGQNIVKQMWQRISGEALLASNSAWGSTYDLKGYQYGTARVEIVNASMIDPTLLEGSVTVEMKDNVTTISPGYNLLFVGRHSDPSPNAVLQIERLYDRYAFEGLKYKQVTGTVGGRKIQLKTSSELLPKPALSMELKVEVRGNFWKYRTLFEAAVPEAMIHAIDAGYEIDLDALPLSEKIKKEATIRLSMKYKLEEMSLTFENKETWVVGVN